MGKKFPIYKEGLDKKGPQGQPLLSPEKLEKYMSFFTKEAASLAPWSISKAKTGTQCPWKFKYQYIDKAIVPEDKVFELNDAKLRVGSAVHKYAEEVARGRESSIAEIIALEEGQLVHEEEDEFQSMLESVNAFNEKITDFKKSKNVIKDLIEVRLGISEDLKPTGFFSKDAFFRGVMDRALLTEDGTAVIIDLKTGKFPSLKYSQDQLNAYSLVAFVTWDFVHTVRPALYFTATGDLLWGKKITRESFPTWENHPTVSFINKSAEEAGTEQIIPGKYCSWCQYKIMCLEERKERRNAAKKSRK